MTVLLQVKLCAPSSEGDGGGGGGRRRGRALPSGGRCAWRLLKGNVMRVSTLLPSYVGAVEDQVFVKVSCGCCLALLKREEIYKKNRGIKYFFFLFYLLILVSFFSIIRFRCLVVVCFALLKH